MHVLVQAAELANLAWRHAFQEPRIADPDSGEANGASTVPRPSRVGAKLAFAAGLLISTSVMGPWSSASAQREYETSFIPSPLDPLAGEDVTFRSLAAGGESWDLDGDGACDDARGSTARHRFPRPGRYRVTLCISSGSFLARSTQEILVAKPQPTFAIVRLQGNYGPTGAQIRQLRVSRSARAWIALRCWGPDCPYPRRSVPPGRRVVVFRGFQRHLRGGTRISIFVTQPRRIGRYTAYRVRGGELAPVRRDRCLQLESLRFTRCPG